MEFSPNIVRQFVGEANRTLEEYMDTRRYKIAKGRAAGIVHLLKLAKEAMAIGEQENYDLEQLMRKLDEFFNQARSVDDRFKQTGKHPADFVIDAVAGSLRPPKPESVMAPTHFLSYRDAAFAIAKQVQDAGKVAEVLKLYLEVPEKEMKHILTNAERLVKKLGVLEKRYTRITRKAIEKYCEIYAGVATYFEKIVLLLVGITRILEGRAVSYAGLKGQGTAFKNRLDVLSSKDFFNEIIKPINPTIRNSIIHETRIIHFQEHKIIFDDQRATVTLSFIELIRQTIRDNSALFLTLSTWNSGNLKRDFSCWLPA